MSDHRPPAPTPEPPRSHHALGTAERAQRQWLALGPRRHALAVAILSLAALILYLGPLLRPGPLADEVLYIDAAARAAAGESPYSVPGFYYPAAFAHLWSFTERWSSEVPGWAIWRAASLSAAVLLVWLSAVYLPGSGRRWGWRVALGAPLLAVPGMVLALTTGNLSVVTALLVVGGVLLVGRRWILGGLLLGASVAIKPLALPALVALAAPRLTAAGPEADRWRPRGEQRGALLGLALSVVALLGFPHSSELFTQPVEALTAGRTVSFERLLGLLGLALPRWIVIFVVYAGVALAAALGSRTRVERSVVALAAAMVAAPVIWSHTLLVGLPILTLALSLSVPPLVAGTQRASGTATMPGGGRERLLAVSAIALVALVLFLQPGGFDHLPRATQIALALPMLAAPPTIAALVIRRLRRVGAQQARRDRAVRHTVPRDARPPRSGE